MGWCQRECRANTAAGFDNCRVKWLIYNAASPVAFAESTVASQDQGRKRENETKSMAWVSVKWSLCLFKNRKTPSVQLWMANFTSKSHSPRVIRARRDSIYNLGHARNAKAHYCLPLSSWLMLHLCFAAQTRLSAWKCFSNVRVELWTDRFRLRSLSSPKRLSKWSWTENLVQCSLWELAETDGSAGSVWRAQALPGVKVVTKETLRKIQLLQNKMWNMSSCCDVQCWLIIVCWKETRHLTSRTWIRSLNVTDRFFN